MTNEERAYTEGYAQALRDIHTHIAYEWMQANGSATELPGSIYKPLSDFLERLIDSKKDRLKETDAP